MINKLKIPYKGKELKVFQNLKINKNSIKN